MSITLYLRAFYEVLTGIYDLMEIKKGEVMLTSKRHRGHAEGHGSSCSPAVGGDASPEEV